MLVRREEKRREEKEHLAFPPSKQQPKKINPIMVFILASVFGLDPSESPQNGYSDGTKIILLQEHQKKF